MSRSLIIIFCTPVYSIICSKNGLNRLLLTPKPLKWSTVHVDLLRVSGSMAVYLLRHLIRCLHRVSEKSVQNCFYQNFVKCPSIWQVDEKMAKIIRYVNIFHLTSLMASSHLVKQKSSIFLPNA